jgi:hypothetical protein
MEDIKIKFADIEIQYLKCMCEIFDRLANLKEITNTGLKLFEWNLLKSGLEQFEIKSSEFSNKTETFDPIIRKQIINRINSEAKQ